MDLLERYVQAVGRYLPPQRRADILAELTANLREEMEDRAEVLGHPLSEQEEAEVLRPHEHPVAAAARYSNAPPLIGPEMAPFYWFTLRRIAPIVVAAIAVSHVAILMYAPMSWEGIGPQVTSVFSALLYFWSWVTALFVALDWWRRRAPEQFVSKWDPLKLPKLRQETSDDRPGHPLLELAFSVVFLAWLLAFRRYPVLLLGPAVQAVRGLPLDLAPVWHTFYWLVVGLNTVQIVFKVIALKAGSAGLRRGLQLAEHVLALGVFAFLLQAREYLVPTPASTASTGVRNLAMWNGQIHRVLLLLVAIAAFKVVWDFVQMFSRRESREDVQAAVL